MQTYIVYRFPATYVDFSIDRSLFVLDKTRVQQRCSKSINSNWDAVKVTLNEKKSALSDVDF